MFNYLIYINKKINFNKNGESLLLFEEKDE